ncbi:hypothetical protein AVEN_254763-1 [Araneus ventricosus]|uniref:Uncharacterized protein n=1 Tax=Araneus ventricosus TaxID=182803 RepID=A0A4Y2G9J2_ARAVE|nr:hypothetical protein AVEN_254763-1 [Araneus ventricosus]
MHFFSLCRSDVGGAQIDGPPDRRGGRGGWGGPRAGAPPAPAQGPRPAQPGREEVPALGGEGGCCHCQELHKILWVAVSSTVGLPVERRRHLIVIVVVRNRLGISLGCKVDAVALTNQTFHLFGPLKQHLGGKHFADDNDVLWMRKQPKEFYVAGIGALIKRWDKCINMDGDYVQK